MGSPLQEKLKTLEVSATAKSSRIYPGIPGFRICADSVRTNFLVKAVAGKREI